MNALIFQCPACRALVGAARVELQPGRAGLRCEACGSVAWLPESAGGTEARVVDVEPAPRAQVTRELPPASGGALVVAAPSAPAPPVSTFGTELRERIRQRLASKAAPIDRQRELAADFDRLLDAWHGEDAHKALLKRASRDGELAFVGQCYRAVLDVAPNDAGARRAQGEILTLAVGALSATRDLGALGDDIAGKTRRRTLAATLILFAFAAIILWAMRERSGLLRGDAEGAKMMFDRPAGEAAR